MPTWRWSVHSFHHSAISSIFQVKTVLTKDHVIQFLFTFKTNHCCNITLAKPSLTFLLVLALFCYQLQIDYCISVANRIILGTRTISSSPSYYDLYVTKSGSILERLRQYPCNISTNTRLTGDESYRHVFCSRKCAFPFHLGCLFFLANLRYLLLLVNLLLLISYDSNNLTS